MNCVKRLLCCPCLRPTQGQRNTEIASPTPAANSAAPNSQDERPDFYDTKSLQPYIIRLATESHRTSNKLPKNTSELNIVELKTILSEAKQNLDDFYRENEINKEHTFNQLSGFIIDSLRPHNFDNEESCKSAISQLLYIHLIPSSVDDIFDDVCILQKIQNAFEDLHGRANYEINQKNQVNNFSEIHQLLKSSNKSPRKFITMLQNLKKEKQYNYTKIYKVIEGLNPKDQVWALLVIGNNMKSTLSKEALKCTDPEDWVLNEMLLNISEQNLLELELS